MDPGKMGLPIGISDFAKLRQGDYYYIDKTELIRDLMDHPPEVTLFTRPRRFGKTLTMSMLEKFFSVDGDKDIFDGLEITKYTDLCEEHMGKYPVISLSLREIEGTDYKEASEMTAAIINEAAQKVKYLLGSNNLDEDEKDDFRQLLDPKMSDVTLIRSLKILSSLLEKHHGKKVILLIDEYDVPLQKAHLNNYYEQMVPLIRGLLSSVLKDNNNLQFAVLTGCLRISKESIFSGLNNLKVSSITDIRFDDAFGFTDTEVKELLAYFGFSEKYEKVKQWYGGYLFGAATIYCPWNILNYCDDLKYDPEKEPHEYWAETSGNEAVNRLIQRTALDPGNEDLIRLLAGKSIRREICRELTVDGADDSEENLWSLLYWTGYLTKQGETKESEINLIIPNLEVRTLFKKTIRDYFKATVCADKHQLRSLCTALQKGDAKKVEELFTDYLQSNVKDPGTDFPFGWKKDFYLVFLSRILSADDRLNICLDVEGEDMLLDMTAQGHRILIQAETASEKDLEAASRQALERVQEKGGQSSQDQPYQAVLRYGIGCFHTNCRVRLRKD